MLPLSPGKCGFHNIFGGNMENRVNILASPVGFLLDCLISLALLSNFVRWDGGIKSSSAHATVTHAARR